MTPIKRLVPPKSILDPGFGYVASHSTDISKRFARDPKYAAFLAEREKRRRDEQAQDDRR